MVVRTVKCAWGQLMRKGIFEGNRGSHQGLGFSSTVGWSLLGVVDLSFLSLSGWHCLQSPQLQHPSSPVGCTLEPNGNELPAMTSWVCGEVLSRAQIRSWLPGWPNLPAHPLARPQLQPREGACRVEPSSGPGSGSLVGYRRSLLAIGWPIFAWAGSLPAIAGAWVRCFACNRPPMWHGDPRDGETKSVYWAFMMCYCLKSSSSTQLAGLPWEW